MNIFETPIYIENIELDNKSILEYCKKLKISHKISCNIFKTLKTSCKEKEDK